MPSRLHPSNPNRGPGLTSGPSNMIKHSARKHCCSRHRESAPRQVDILQHLGASLNVAYCYGAYEQPQCVGIVMELLSGGELWSRIRQGHYSEAG